MEQRYKDFLKGLLDQYKTDIQFVDSEKLKCNALIFKLKDRYTILCKKNLPDNVKFFSILHEIGHIALDYFSKDPFFDWSIEVETEINLWALEKLKDNVEKSFFLKTKELFLESEDKGYKNINLYLDKYFFITKERHMQLKLNDNLIVREEDGTLFNFEEFRVHQFNDIGIDIITPLKEEISKEKWFEMAESLNVSKENMESFFKKCLDSEIIVTA